MRTTRIAGPHSYRAILAGNLRRLMLRRGWKQMDLAQKSGVSQTHVGKVLRRESSATADILEALGSAFGIPGWLLLVDGVPVEILDSPELPALIHRYAALADQAIEQRRLPGPG